MSFEIDWDKLRENPSVNQQIKDFLNSQFKSVELPSYVKDLKVLGFSLGQSAPNIILRHIDEPFKDFYEYLQQDDDYDATEDIHNDIQFIVEVEYKGDMYIELQANLLLNYPTPGFMTLPVKLRVTDLRLHALFVVAHVAKNVFISCLCDVGDEDLDQDYTGMLNKSIERVSVIRNIKIESEIGKSGDGSVLRNVGKLEQFLLETIQNMLRNEIGWPGWLCFDFNPEQ